MMEMVSNLLNRSLHQILFLHTIDANTTPTPGLTAVQQQTSNVFLYTFFFFLFIFFFY